MLIGSLVLHGVGKVGYGWVQRDMIMGWGKVGYMGLGKDEDMMVNPCLPITAALRSLSPPGSVGPRGLSRTEPEWVEKCGPKEMQRLDWSLSRKVTQDIKTQPQINHYQSNRSSLWPGPLAPPFVPCHSALRAVLRTVTRGRGKRVNRGRGSVTYVPFRPSPVTHAATWRDRPSTRHSSTGPLTRPISLRMPLTPPIRSLATLSPYPHGSASPPRSSAPRFVRRLFTPHSVSSAPWPEPRRETTMMRGAVPAAGPFARHSLTSSLTRPGGPSLTHALPRYTRGPLS